MARERRARRRPACAQMQALRRSQSDQAFRGSPDAAASSHSRREELPSALALLTGTSLAARSKMRCLDLTANSLWLARSTWAPGRSSWLALAGSIDSPWAPSNALAGSICLAGGPDLAASARPWRPATAMVGPIWLPSHVLAGSIWLSYAFLGALAGSIWLPCALVGALAGSIWLPGALLGALAGSIWVP